MPIRNCQKLDTLRSSFLGVQKLMTSLKSLKLGSAKMTHKANDLLQVTSDGRTLKAHSKV